MELPHKRRVFGGDICLSAEYADILCKQFCPKPFVSNSVLNAYSHGTLREVLEHTDWRRLTKRGSIYVAMGKSSSILGADFPVLTL